jgi:predicted nucleotidyltransferase
MNSHPLNTLLTINDFAWSLYNSNPVNSKKRNMNPKEISLLLKNLNTHEVKYILIGGFAMAFHGFPRATGDIDLWIKNTPDNMTRLRDALIDTGITEAKALRTTTQLVGGFTMFNLLESDFRIDLLHNLKAFKETDFDKCLQSSLQADYEGVTIKVMDAHSLLKEKVAVNRDKDQSDINFLRGLIEKLMNKLK